MRRLLPLAVVMLLSGACRAPHSPPPPIVDLPPPPSATPVAEIAAPQPAPSSVPEAPPAPPPRPVVREIVEIDPPSSAWRAVETEAAFGYSSVYFGRHEVEDRGFLRPLAAWRWGERGRIKIYRLVDPETGDAVEISREGYRNLRPKKLTGDVLWYEMPSDGTQFYWYTSGSVLIEASDELKRGGYLAATIRRWIPRALEALAKPRVAP
jgi:hypothetical protein